MKYKTFLCHIFKSFHPTYPSSNCQMKIFAWCFDGSTPPIKNGRNPLWFAPYMMTLKSPPPSQRTCSSKSHKYENYDKATYKVPPLLLVSPGKPVYQAIH